MSTVEMLKEYVYENYLDPFCKIKVLSDSSIDVRYDMTGEHLIVSYDYYDAHTIKVVRL